MKRFFNFLIFAFSLSSGLVGLSVWQEAHNGHVQLSLSRAHGNSPFGLAQSPSINIKDMDALAASSHARVNLAKAVIPSVVSISSSKKVPPRQRRFSQDPLYQYFYGQGPQEGSPEDEDQDQGMAPPFGRGGSPHGNPFGGGSPGGGDEMGARSLGSGVIVSKEGHILTNNHVIDGMDQIEVELNDHRKLKAKVIGADPATDLAVLKIDAPNIQPLPFGDSDNVEVGESVLAIGNPYGLEETVTQGIISAKERPGGLENLNDFFQIDAAINPGNSGGALINVHGELIGINAAIFSQSGGFQGVGFAIPSNIAKHVLDSLLNHGRVIRGYLGVNLRPISAQEAKSLQLPDAEGALVGTVQPNSPAEKAGIKPGDFIRKFNNKTVNTINALRREVTSAKINQTVPAEVLRAGKPVNLQIQIEEQPKSFQYAVQVPFGKSKGPKSGALTSQGPLAGIAVQDLTAAIAHKLWLPPNVEGVVVSKVSKNAPAFGELRRGDVIEAINQQPINSVDQYQEIMQGLNDDSRVALSIIRNRARSFVVITPEE